MIKAFALIDGVELNGMVDGELAEFKFEDNELMHRVYNPITDLALIMKATLDYSVSTEHNWDPLGRIVYLTTPCPDYITVHFMDEKDYGRAVIECILKSEGKWV